MCEKSISEADLKVLVPHLVSPAHKGRQFSEGVVEKKGLQREQEEGLLALYSCLRRCCREVRVGIFSQITEIG